MLQAPKFPLPGRCRANRTQSCLEEVLLALNSAQAQGQTSHLRRCSFQRRALAPGVDGNAAFSRSRLALEETALSEFSRFKTLLFQQSILGWSILKLVFTHHALLTDYAPAKEQSLLRSSDFYLRPLSRGRAHHWTTDYAVSPVEFFSGPTKYAKARALIALGRQKHVTMTSPHPRSVHMMGLRAQVPLTCPGPRGALCGAGWLLLGQLVSPARAFGTGQPCTVRSRAGKRRHC